MGPESILTVILGLLVLGFLIFIHELGHYFAARRTGMRVDVFSIGFGPTLLQWKVDGVVWKLGVLPFGGYVKIAGMYDDEGGDPRDILDGYYGKGPIARIFVAIMGPLVNLLFALLVFTVLYTSGGREKTFGQYSKHIGWVDPKSELYEKGVRPGDVISSYEGRDFKSSRDHLVAPMLSDPEFDIEGIHISRGNGSDRPFKYKVKKYPLPNILEEDIVTAGIQTSAQYIIYDNEPVPGLEKLKPSTSLLESGIQSGDRIFWIDGEPIYSRQQMGEILNDPQALVTISRGGQTLLRRVPRLPIMEFQLTSQVRDELTDWQFEAGLRQTEFKQLQFLPYNLTPQGVVEAKLKFLDKEDSALAFPKVGFSERNEPLLPGDRIIAIDGVPVSSGYEILQAVQEHRVSVIVERGKDYKTPIPIEDADKGFNRFVQWQDVDMLAASIGTSRSRTRAGSFHLLKPIKTVTQREFLKEDARKEFDERVKEQRAKILSQLQGDKQKAALAALEDGLARQFIGIPSVRDRTVIYNPPPLEAFSNLLTETFDTLRALFSGFIGVKALSGPVGIMQIVGQQWRVGWQDLLFWMAFISQQLGLLNLLPIPVLDGGHICFALYEMLTGRSVGQKTMERMTIPFYFALIGLAIFLTYNDVLRLIRSLFMGF